MINYIFWDISPIALKLGPLEIRWYGILLATGFFFAYLTFLNIFKKEGMSQEFTDKFAIRLVLWTVVGLRLGHVLFYEPAYYFKHPLEIFMIWKGGLASHGAVIGIIGYSIYFTRKNKMPVLWLFDRVAASVMIAAGMVRMGNLMNSEIYGKPTDVSGLLSLPKTICYPDIHRKFMRQCVSIAFVFLIWYYKNLREKCQQGGLWGYCLQ